MILEWCALYIISLIQRQRMIFSIFMKQKSTGTYDTYQRVASPESAEEVDASKIVLMISKKCLHDHLLHGEIPLSNKDTCYIGMNWHPFTNRGLSRQQELAASCFVEEYFHVEYSFLSLFQAPQRPWRSATSGRGQCGARGPAGTTWGTSTPSCALTSSTDSPRSLPPPGKSR